MGLGQNTIDFKEMEIFMLTIELKMFVQRMQAEGFLSSVDINDVMKFHESELERSTS